MFGHFATNRVYILSLLYNYIVSVSVIVVVNFRAVNVVIMSRFQRKTVFSLEESREAVLDSDSENGFHMDLSSEEE